MLVIRSIISLCLGHVNWQITYGNGSSYAYFSRDGKLAIIAEEQFDESVRPLIKLIKS